MNYPILDNNGRTVLAYAKTQASAMRWLKKNLGDHSVSLFKHGFALRVWLREPWIAELNGGPIGWMFSVGK